MKSAQWLKVKGAQPMCGDAMSITVPGSRRIGRVIGSKPGWVLVLYTL